MLIKTITYFFEILKYIYGGGGGGGGGKSETDVWKPLGFAYYYYKTTKNADCLGHN